MKALDLRCEGLVLSRPVTGGALVDVSLPPGSAMVVVGRNGAGKSTLLHTVSGLLSSTEGQVRVGGRPVHAIDARERAQWISLVTSTPPKPAGLTVADVVALGAKAGGRELDAASLRAELEVAGIAQWAKMSLDTLSDGMAQRVMVARAGVQSKSVMLLDEPTAFLDLVGREDVMSQVGRWKGDERILMVATHDLVAVAEAGWSTHWLHVHPGRGRGATLHEGPLDVEQARAALRTDSA